MKYDKTNQTPTLEEVLHRLHRLIRRSPSSTGPRRSRSTYLLEIVSENDHSSSRELAELMDIRPSSLTEMLNGMEAEGWITRNKDENDQRIVRVSLAPAGRGVLEVLESVESDRFEGILTPEETAQFFALCTKLCDGLIAQQCSSEEKPARGCRQHGHGRDGGKGHLDRDGHHGHGHGGKDHAYHGFGSKGGR